MAFPIRDRLAVGPEHGNVHLTVLPLLARTAAPSKEDFVNRSARGIVVVIDVTAVSDTPGLTVTIQGKDPLSGKYYTILASSSITGVGTTVLRAYPGLTAAANVSANDVVPLIWAINCAHADSDSITYSIAAHLIA